MSDHDDHDSMLYMDIITAFLDEAVLDELEEDMMRTQSTQLLSNYAKRHHDRGHQSGLEHGLEQGLEHALLTVLETRGIELSDEALTRLEDCHDPAVLQQWHRRALVIDDVDDLFAD